VVQVSGRAGRKNASGKVLIQTAVPSAPVITHIIRQDYEAFYAQEIEERRLYYSPPFTRLIKLSVRSDEQARSQETARLLADRLRAIFGEAGVLGPNKPVVEKIRNLYYTDILLKFDRANANMQHYKAIILQEIYALSSINTHKKAQVLIDVDPN